MNTGSFQTGFSYQQAQPQQPAQPTRPFQIQNDQQPYGTGQMFQTGNQQIQQPYQPTFSGNGQVTGGFTPIPQTQAMTTDSHGVQGYLRRKK